MVVVSSNPGSLNVFTAACSRHFALFNISKTLSIDHSRDLHLAFTAGCIRACCVRILCLARLSLVAASNLINYYEFDYIKNGGISVPLWIKFISSSRMRSNRSLLTTCLWFLARPVRFVVANRDYRASTCKINNSSCSSCFIDSVIGYCFSYCCSRVLP